MQACTRLQTMALRVTAYEQESWPRAKGERSAQPAMLLSSFCSRENKEGKQRSRVDWESLSLSHTLAICCVRMLLSNGTLQPAPGRAKQRYTPRTLQHSHAVHMLSNGTLRPAAPNSYTPRPACALRLFHLSEKAITIRRLRTRARRSNPRVHPVVDVAWQVGDGAQRRLLVLLVVNLGRP